MQGTTYRQEIEAARDLLHSAAKAATEAPWEEVVDHHQRGITERGIWSITEGRYVAELTGKEADARYVQLMDPGSGLTVVNLMTSFLEGCGDELDTSDGHNECSPAECQIASFVALARRLNGVKP